MPRSNDYHEMYNLLCDRFTPSPVERLQMAVWIDILAALEKMEPKANVASRKPRKPKPSK